jgi:hypothetical protein
MKNGDACRQYGDSPDDEGYQLSEVPATQETGLAGCFLELRWLRAQRKCCLDEIWGECDAWRQVGKAVQQPHGDPSDRRLGDRLAQDSWCARGIRIHLHANPSEIVCRERRRKFSWPLLEVRIHERGEGCPQD